MPNEYCVLLLQTLACRHAASVKGSSRALYGKKRSQQMVMLVDWLCTSISDLFYFTFVFTSFIFFPLFFYIYIYMSNIFWTLFLGDYFFLYYEFFCLLFAVIILDVLFRSSLVGNSMHCTFTCLGEHCLVRVVWFVPCLANYSRA